MKRLVLAGAGHARALVLRELVRQPMPGVDVVVVSPEPMGPYSGMVPGWLAGHYRFDEMAIDFPPLVAAAGARWHQGEIQGVGPARRQLQLADGCTLEYDVLSLDIGSTLQPLPAEHAQMLPLRPLAMLRQRYEAFDATLLTVVHDTELLPRLADRVIGLKEGRLVFDVPLQAPSPDLLKNLYETGDPADGYHRDPRTNLPLALPLRPRGFPTSAGRCTA